MEVLFVWLTEVCGKLSLMHSDVSVYGGVEFVAHSQVFVHKTCRRRRPTRAIAYNTADMTKRNAVI